MTGVLIAFYSRTGVTEKLAYAVAEEALEAERTCACAASAISLRNTLSKKVPAVAEHRDRMHKAYEALTGEDAQQALCIEMARRSAQR